jgi:predicted enzyme related to lactoylglutathione lyase
VPGARPALIEFPADDADRALRFWSGILGEDLVRRSGAQGRGWQSASTDTLVGVHERGTGPGDTASLPYFEVPDIALAVQRVSELGGTVIHPGERWAICRDSEGSPFALAAAGDGGA